MIAMMTNHLTKISIRSSLGHCYFYFSQSISIITRNYFPISNISIQFIMILIKILVLNSIVHGESDQKQTFETVKVNSGIHVGKGFTHC